MACSCQRCKRSAAKEQVEAERAVSTQVYRLPDGTLLRANGSQKDPSGRIMLELVPLYPAERGGRGGRA